MKILFVATEYPEKGRPTTGFPNYLYRISLALVRMGHTPIILGAGKKADHRMEQGIDIWMIKTERKNYNSEVFNYAVNGLRKSYLLNKKAKKIIKSYSVDVVQFTSLEGSAIFYRGKIPAVLRLSSYAKTYFSSLKKLSESSSFSFWSSLVISTATLFNFAPKILCFLLLVDSPTKPLNPGACTHWINFGS